MCTVHHNTIIPELNDATEREGEWVGFPVHSQTALVGSQFSKHLQQSGGETTPRKTKDVLSVVYQLSQNTEEERKHTRTSLSLISLSEHWPQWQSRWTLVNPITLCALLPQGAFCISSPSLKIHRAKAWQLSVHKPRPNTDLITHTHGLRSVCTDYIIHTSTICATPILRLPSVCLHWLSHMCGWEASRALSEIPSENNVGEDVVKKQSKFLPFHVKETALTALNSHGLHFLSSGTMH